MRTIGLFLAAAVIGFSSLAIAADMTPLERAPVVVHRHHHHYRVHVQRVHFGYYWYRWGWRTGGTARSWYGSTFTWAEPRVWW